MAGILAAYDADPHLVAADKHIERAQKAVTGVRMGVFPKDMLLIACKELLEAIEEMGESHERRDGPTPV